MTMGIIEINDAGIHFTFGRKSWQSPGYALYTADSVVLGTQALNQSRLHPLKCSNQFWNRLSTEPLTSGNPKVRHNADLAHLHLQEIHQFAPECSDVVFAVPENYNNEQLSLLLGIAEQCSFNAVGLVSASVAQLAPLAAIGTHLYLDIHLHHSVITTLSAKQQISFESNVSIASCGLIHLTESWAKLISDHFIQQLRFDPQHDANTEQQLYGEIYRYLEAPKDAMTPIIKGKQIKINRELLVEKSKLVFAEFIRAIRQQGSITSIYMSDRLASLPGLLEAVPTAIRVPENSIASACEKNKDLITSEQTTLKFINQLPISKSNVSAPTLATSAPLNEPTTHILCDNKAYPLNGSTIYVTTSPILKLSKSPQPNASCVIKPDQNQLLLSVLDNNSVSVNHNTIKDSITLRCGDTIQVGNGSQNLAAINVLNSDVWS